VRDNNGLGVASRDWNFKFFLQVEMTGFADVACVGRKGV
jgi:hypothetical protein